MSTVQQLGDGGRTLAKGPKDDQGGFAKWPDQGRISASAEEIRLGPNDSALKRGERAEWSETSFLGFSAQRDRLRSNYLHQSLALPSRRCSGARASPIGLEFFRPRLTARR